MSALSGVSAIRLNVFGLRAPLNAGAVKAAYESNDDTNAFTDADASKLAGIAAGAQVNAVTSVAGKTGAVALVSGDVGLGNVPNLAAADLPISTATQTALNLKASTAIATTLVNGLMTAASVVKLNGIATGATANSSDAFLLARANQTGFQAIGTVTGLQSALDGKADGTATTTALAGKASAADLTTEVTRATGVEGGLNTRIGALETTIVTKTSIATVVQTQGRPGDVLDRFTPTLTGIAANAALVAGQAIATSSNGSILSVTGSQIVGTRERISTDPLASIRFRWAAIRVTDPTDPSGATLRFGLQFLTQNKTDNGQHVVRDMTLHVSDGRQTQTFTIAAANGAGVDFTWPTGTCYVVPFIQTFDLDGITDFQVIEWEDVTSLLAIEAGSNEGVGQVAADLAQEVSDRQNTDTGLDQRIDGEIARAVAAEAGEALSRTSGDDALRGKRGFSLGWVRGSALIYAITLTMTGAALEARDLSGTKLEPLSNGVLNDHPFNTRGFSLGWLSGQSGAPMEWLETNRGQRAMQARTANAELALQASGAWLRVSVSQRGFSLGFSPSGNAIRSIDTTVAGRLITGQRADGALFFPLQNGLYATDQSFRGFSIGFTTQGSAIKSIETTSRGRMLNAQSSDGPILTPRRSGMLPLDPNAARGFSIGFLSPDADSAATAIDVTPRGRLLCGRGVGAAAYGLNFVATVSGIISRVESPVAAASLFQAGPTVQIPSVRIRNRSGWLYTQQSVVTSPAPAQVTVNSESQTIRYNDNNLYQGGTDNSKLVIGLAYQFFIVGSTVMRRVSDNSLMTTASDYREYDTRGILMGIDAAHATTPAIVSYQGVNQRADIVWTNPDTGAIGITLGNEVPRTAAEWEPDYPGRFAPAPAGVAAIPSGMVPIFRIFRYRDGCDIQPLHLYRAGVRTDFAPQIEADIARNRRYAAAIRSIVESKMAAARRWLAGETVADADRTLTMSLYGDSIGAVDGAGSTPSNHNTVPNGTRDSLPFFQAYDATTKALITTYGTDGSGNPKVRESWGWRVLNELQSRAGFDGSGNPALIVVMRNWCIGGTDSSATLQGSGYMNQGYPDRLNAWLADAWDFGLYVPGMNDLGFTIQQEYDQVKVILAAAKTASKPLVLASTDRIHPGYADTTASWLRICTALDRVTDDMRIPFADSRRVFDVSTTGASGLSPLEWAGANTINHGQRKEFAGVDIPVLELIS